jgi:hypothetical protein
MKSEPLSPPIPPPSGDNCPNCGVKVNAKSEFCLQCGAQLRIAEVRHANDSTGCFSALLSCGAVSFGFLGTCAGIFSYSAGMLNRSKLFSPSNWNDFALLALFWFSITALCIFGLWKVKRE